MYIQDFHTTRAIHRIRCSEDFQSICSLRTYCPKLTLGRLGERLHVGREGQGRAARAVQRRESQRRRAQGGPEPKLMAMD